MDTHRPTTGSDAGARVYPGAASHNDPADQTRHELKQQAETAGHELRAVGRQVQGQVADVAQQAKAGVSDAAGQAQRKAAQYAQQAQAHGRDMIDQQRQRAGQQIQTLGDAVRRAADKFREENDNNIAGYVDAAADEVSRLGDYLQRRDLPNLLRDSQDLARRRPEWFLGGMFVAGLALTRFLKASARRSEGYDLHTNDAPGRYTPPAATGYRSQSSGGVGAATGSSVQAYGAHTGGHTSAATISPSTGVAPVAAPTPSVYTMGARAVPTAAPTPSTATPPALPTAANPLGHQPPEVH